MIITALTLIYKCGIVGINYFPAGQYTKLGHAKTTHWNNENQICNLARWTALYFYHGRVSVWRNPVKNSQFGKFRALFSPNFWCGGVSNSPTHLPFGLFWIYPLIFLILSTCIAPLVRCAKIPDSETRIAFRGKNTSCDRNHEASLAGVLNDVSKMEIERGVFPHFRHIAYRNLSNTANIGKDNDGKRSQSDATISRRWINMFAGEDGRSPRVSRGVFASTPWHGDGESTWLCALRLRLLIPAR